MKRETRLYNVIFPVWMLFLFPMTWLIVLPANFLIDSAVLLIALRVMKQGRLPECYKRSILWVWVIGFLSDFAGGAFLMLSQFVGGWVGEGAFGDWWYDHITGATVYNPFQNLWSFLYVLLAVAISGALIYALNRRISFRKLDLEPRVKQKLSLALAVFTAPWLFFLPASLFYR